MPELNHLPELVVVYGEDGLLRIWKDMSLNDSLSEVERAKLAVWDYPVSDKYTKIWQAMKEAMFPNSMEQALERVRESKSSSEGYAFLGMEHFSFISRNSLGSINAGGFFFLPFGQSR
uniref:Uncharacterized protein n=1 Tax=Timema monikensis TaxID=170555 RepID=A0A7R9EGT3_9NEOP|nr:unnamed protein product [Timema monikensis]